jgi:hypothetical protein
VGIAVVLFLKARRPEAVARIGSMLGEEGGEAAGQHTPTARA